MDLLGSILNSMDKPPVTVTEQQKKALKKQQEDQAKRQELERAKLKKFREKYEKHISDFIQDDSKKQCSFEPMDKVQRSIVHDIAEVAGLLAYSFGEEEIDRHIVVYKKEFAPCSEELNALRKGLVWDPEAAKLNAAASQEDSSDDGHTSANKRKMDGPSSSSPAPYLHKYERLLGKETAKEAAKVTKVNKQFGCVPASNKTDQRSIEQTLADIRAKKKQKLDNN